MYNIQYTIIFTDSSIFFFFLILFRKPSKSGFKTCYWPPKTLNYYSSRTSNRDDGDGWQFVITASHPAYPQHNKGDCLQTAQGRQRTTISLPYVIRNYAREHYSERWRTTRVRQYSVGRLPIASFSSQTLCHIIRK